MNKKREIVWNSESDTSTVVYGDLYDVVQSAFPLDFPKKVRNDCN